MIEKMKDKQRLQRLEIASNNHLRELLQSIEAAAAHPGALVYMTALKLPYQLGTMNPLLLSSLDLFTHLQIARIYMTQTVASAVDFLEFVKTAYPFPIKEVRTFPGWLFTDPNVLQQDHKFTLFARQQGITHSVLYEKTDDMIFWTLKNFFYEGQRQMDQPLSEDHLLSDLINFLFFHNNHRSLVTLDGKTPIQKLHSFEGYDRLSTFDPYEALHISR